ncbi:hypothetical protein HY772_07070 [Candidatus Woesearchaeota archaeon]|nr:hypothetical protein [Candidatus Woesearchaeota archaeon]
MLRYSRNKWKFRILGWGMVFLAGQGIVLDVVGLWVGLLWVLRPSYVVVVCSLFTISGVTGFLIGRQRAFLPNPKRFPGRFPSQSEVLGMVAIGYITHLSYLLWSGLEKSIPAIAYINPSALVIIFWLISLAYLTHLLGAAIPTLNPGILETLYNECVGAGFERDEVRKSARQLSKETGQEFIITLCLFILIIPIAFVAVSIHEKRRFAVTLAGAFLLVTLGIAAYGKIFHSINTPTPVKASTGIEKQPVKNVKKAK